MVFPNTKVITSPHPLSTLLNKLRCVLIALRINSEMHNICSPLLIQPLSSSLNCSHNDFPLTPLPPKTRHTHSHPSSWNAPPPTFQQAPHAHPSDIRSMMTSSGKPGLALVIREKLLLYAPIAPRSILKD